LNEYLRRLIATAVIEQAVIDFRIARQYNLIDSETLKAKENLPKRLPQQLEADDLASLKSFIFRDLEPFIDYTGLRIYRPVQSVAELKTETGRSKSSALNQVYSSTKEDGHQTRYSRQNRKEKRGHHMVAETEINAEGNGL